MRHHIRSLCFSNFLLLLSVLLSLNVNAAGNTRQQIAESMLKKIDRTTWVSEGTGQHIIYIFFDPNCPYCHHLYENTRDWIEENEVQLRWIPLGLLTATSAGKAAAILGAKDPRQAFYENENHYKRGEGGGGIMEDIPSREVERKLNTNASVFNLSGVGAFPLMLFRAKDNTPYMITGVPPKKNLAIILQNLK
jgi:thiol:disulfide interchange protein DsbG